MKPDDEVLNPEEAAQLRNKHVTVAAKTASQRMVRRFRCPVCGDETHAPVRAALWHFRLLDLEHKSFWTETRKTFGLLAALCLASPLVNILVNWKHRRSKLDL